MLLSAKWTFIGTVDRTLYPTLKMFPNKTMLITKSDNVARE